MHQYVRVRVVVLWSHFDSIKFFFSLFKIGTENGAVIVYLEYDCIIEIRVTRTARNLPIWSKFLLTRGYGMQKMRFLIY